MIRKNPVYRSVLLIVIISIVSAGIAPAVAQTQPDSGQVIGQPDISVLTSTLEFEPGTQAQLDLSLVNRGRLIKGGPARYESRVTTARGLTLTAKSGDTPIEINTGTLAVGSVPLGTTDIKPIQVTVDEDASPGTYRIPIEYEYAYTRIVEYDQFGAEFTDIVRDETDTVTIRINDQPQFEVINIESRAQVGASGDVAITLRNTGTETARDASVKASSRTSELSFVGGSQQRGAANSQQSRSADGSGQSQSTAFVGHWAPNDTKTVVYTLDLAEDAPHRSYTLDLDVQYTDTDGIRKTSRPLTAGVSTAAKQSFTISEFETQNLRVDETNATVSGVLTNTGPFVAHNIVARLTTSDPVRATAPEAAIGTLAPGESTPIRFQLAVGDDAEPGSRSLTFDISYETDTGELRNAPDPIRKTVMIGQEEDQFTIAEYDVEDLRVDEEGTFKGTIVNTGPKAVSNPVLTIESDNPNININTPDYALSDLEPGEQSSFAYQIEVSSSADAGIQQFSFTVRYRDSDGDIRHSDQLEARAKIKPQRDRFSVEIVNTSIKTGTQSAIQVQITNNGNETLTDIEAKTFVDDPLDSDDNEGFISKLKPGESTNFIISLSVSENALSKTYSITFDFQYEMPSGETRLSDSYQAGIAVVPSEQGFFSIGLVVGVVAIGLLGGAFSWRQRRTD